MELLDSIVNGLSVSWRIAEDLLAVPMFLSSIPIFIGAWNMRHGLRYRWAFAAAVLASTPLLTPLFCWGLPLGIWAVVMLHRKEIKAVFAARAE